MGLTIDDLLPVIELKESRDKLGTLKVAEVLVENQDWTEGYFGVDLNFGKTFYFAELFFYGALKDGTKVRVKKKEIGVPAWEVDEKDAKGLDERALKIANAIKEKYPKKGDALAVYWFSEKLQPTFFIRDRYVYPILSCLPNEDINYISRGDIVNTQEYVTSIFANLPKESSFTTKVKEDLSFRNDFNKDKQLIIASLSSKVMDYGELIKWPLEEVEAYAQKHDLVKSELIDFLKSHKSSMNYRDILSLFVSWNIPKIMAESWYNMCRLEKAWKSSDQAWEIHRVTIMADRFYGNLIDNLRELFQRKECQQIDISDVTYQARAAFNSAFSSVYNIQLHTLWGSYGGWERRHAATVKPKPS